jgi:hypothetical protein
MERLFCKCGSKTAHLGKLVTKILFVVCVSYTLYSLIL